MKVLNCSEVCCRGCTFVAKGNSDSVVIKTMFSHGELHHKELCEDMNDLYRKKISNQMHALIKEL